MFFLPLRSDRPLRTPPYVNYGLIAVNVVIYGLTAQAFAGQELTKAHEFMLWKHPSPDSEVVITRLWQFITYQFLHGGPVHLIGNMIFLWVFGNAVEDRLGKLGYLFFYLSMGVLAGIGHWLTSDNPVLGASGSVAGVTGAFLMLFPLTRITFFYWFFFIGFFEISAKWVILFYFVKDLLFYGIELSNPGVGGVAYTAHLAGNLGGFLVALALLASRLLSREPYDLFTMWGHKRRRDEFKKLTRDGYQAWENRAHHPGKDSAAEMTEEDKQVLELRQQISRAVAGNDLDAAAKTYIRLITEHGEQTLSQRQQFDIANHLFSMGEHANAAVAYERLLSAYPKHDERGRAQLMLGLINARYLDNPEAAKPHLQEASQRLQGDDAALARQLLSEIG
ncbi:MAG: rhomboid family intramembrane serine protease [Planctomycetota bacterium]